MPPALDHIGKPKNYSPHYDGVNGLLTVIPLKLQKEQQLINEGEPVNVVLQDGILVVVCDESKDIGNWSILMINPTNLVLSGWNRIGYVYFDLFNKDLIILAKKL